MIAVINKTIDTTDNLTYISRPRRFGKSYAAQMLCAYYNNTCDSHVLFDKYKISKDESYEKNINHYHVISLDVTSFISEARKGGLSLQEVPARISAAVKNDVETFTCKDDVLTLLTHLGYLTYEEEPDSYDGDTVVGLVKIPNEEVRSEFDKILRKAKHKSLIELVRRSDHKKHTCMIEEYGKD